MRVMLIEWNNVWKGLNTLSGTERALNRIVFIPVSSNIPSVWRLWVSGQAFVRQGRPLSSQPGSQLFHKCHFSAGTQGSGLHLLPGVELCVCGVAVAREAREEISWLERLDRG